MSGDDEPTGPLLLAACKRGNVSLTKMLVRDIGDDLDINYQDGMGNSGMHYIAKGNHPEVAEVLLERYPAKGDSKLKLDLSLQNNVGDTPAHFAVEGGYVSLLQLMIENGADCGLKNQKGNRPENYARNDEIRKMIHGANVALKMDGQKHAHDKPEDESVEAEKPKEQLPVHVMKAELDPDMIANDSDDD